MGKYQNIDRNERTQWLYSAAKPGQEPEWWCNDGSSACRAAVEEVVRMQQALCEQGASVGQQDARRVRMRECLLLEKDPQAQMFHRHVDKPDGSAGPTLWVGAVCTCVSWTPPPPP